MSLRIANVGEVALSYEVIGFFYIMHVFRSRQHSDSCLWCQELAFVSTRRCPGYCSFSNCGCDTTLDPGWLRVEPIEVGVLQMHAIRTLMTAMSRAGSTASR